MLQACLTSSPQARAKLLSSPSDNVAGNARRDRAVGAVPGVAGVCILEPPRMAKMKFVVIGLICNIPYV